jgi:hypothetical protein
MTEKQKKYLMWGGIVVLGYILFRPSFKLMTSSPKSKKMAMSCGEGQKLEKVDYGDEYRCVPVGGEIPPSNLESVQVNL